ncbi:ABC transporter substrate-binding protein [Rhodospirillum rubrum]|uniref:Extracellular solute-binding protein, family 1 n=2 Tax=Rhodospirillum rubrum TaxID=1085 RepID=Q2RSP8_RHORT|nr:ABC transporter substrate-binding protein [Rhodospirillum rubrum]ABC22847.1 extracellular solute-binding protein, family 1 [Rhodospirillum rubrum ATCC 11170]MBK5954454.1 spermidine/putrescine ABC transporter substrate-binding protein [Rhodospirillum rubrum]QXG78836.1 ABC transporter substrate-binding protein [Rhodospirillum rubrum]HAP99733.1 ABC transporter substrate-binding protein [Rhodospirillum rubrum]
MRLLSRFLSGTALALLASGIAASAQARDLTVVSWGGAYQEAQKTLYFAPFTAETGVAMLDESWDGGIGVLRAKVEGGNATWDVVQVESDELALGCEEGLYEKLDFAKIGGAESYMKEAVSECGVGAIVYNFVLGYDKDKLKTPPKSWADFFDTKTFPGKRGLRNGPKTTLEIALIADGVAPNDVYSVLASDEGVERAFKKLDTIKKDIVFWKAGAQPPQLLASGEVAMTSIYNGRVDAANKADGRHFGIVWDGSLFTIDSWVVLKGSPNVEGAYKYLNYVGKPEVQAKLPMAIAYGVTSKGANAKIDPERLKDLPTAEANIANATEIDTTFWLENIDRLTERFNKWAAVQ